MSEETIKRVYIEKLSRNFEIVEEHRGTHFTGKKMIADAILLPKETESWKNSDVAFAIEFKDTVKFDRTYDTKNYTKWLAQCIDYSNTKWDSFGYLFTLVCPNLVDDIPENLMSNPMFMRNFLGQLGIGEICDSRQYGLTLSIHGNMRIWSESKGVEAGRRMNLKRKFGSR